MRILLTIFATCFLVIYSLETTSQTLTIEQLREGFKKPPPSARPITWWHWTGGNVTKEGITKDLEWMKRAGIGGFQAFDISFGFGQNIKDKITFMSPEWFELIRHTAAEADRLGLEMTMATSGGWSETGGPWVTPEQAIKKIVWSDTTITGGKLFNGLLPQPPVVNGPFRDMKRASSMLSPSGPDETFYADEIILAYRTPTAEKNADSEKPKITNDKGEVIDGNPLFDNSLTTKILLPVPTKDKQSWIQFEFAKPFRSQSFTLGIGPSGTFPSAAWRPGYLQGSNDGNKFTTIVSFPGAQHDIRALPVRTFSFPEVEYRFYRIVFVTGSGISTVGGPDDAGGFGMAAKPPTHFEINEAILYGGARINRWEDKANFAPMFEYETIASEAVNKNSVIPSGEIIVLTSKTDRNGKLQWQVPAGKWTILRIGYALTGSKNGPAIPSATGFEVDKLNAAHVESYYNGYAPKIAAALGPLYGKSMKYFLADSYEADAQNWTDDMVSEFKKRRGYDPTPFLPALTGRVISDAAISDRFLWDFRRTIADLLAQEHYGKLAELVHKDGLKLYSESAGISLPVIQDALLNKSKVDIPMGEFRMEKPWIPPHDLANTNAWKGASERLNAHQADVREAASASHIYSKKITAAESWTFGAYESPAAMKPIGDYWNTQGINQFIFHTSVHQPLDTKPGNIMVGTHLNRNITWAEIAFPFFNYIARNQFILQQGTFVADIAIYLGESIPSAVPYWTKNSPDIPEGYDYDYINTNILLDSTKVENGKIALSNGMKYSLLVLPETNKMTPKVLKKIEQLIAAGAIVTGSKPIQSPGLAGYPQVDKEIALTANEIWGDTDGVIVTQHKYKDGKIYWGAPLQSILAEMSLVKDFAYSRPHADTYISSIHRRIGEADVYFVSNQRHRKENIQFELRVIGKIPEIWKADYGTIEQVSYNLTNDKTIVTTAMEPFESFFIVLEKNAVNNQWAAAEKTQKVLQQLSGSWNLAFPEKSGAPAAVIFDSLYSWTSSPVEGIKYFSGTATYTRNLQTEESWLNSKSKIIIDLGQVKDIAEVFINGKKADVLWKFPYRADITDFIKKGANQLEIKVTNQWTNRISGDVKSPSDKKVLAPGTGALFSGDSGKLLESGLIGPVIIYEERTQ